MHIEICMDGLRFSKTNRENHIFGSILCAAHLTHSSILMPGTPADDEITATVVRVSTNVDINPPCSVPRLLACSSCTVSSHRHRPGLADVMST